MLVNSKWLNGWNLFLLITGPICVAVVARMSAVDMSNARDISSMIQFSVRCSVPWLYLAFAASSIFALFPGSFGRWAMRNRRYVGLCFAAGMAWQLVFILMMVTGHWTYYVEDVYAFGDIIVQIPGYLFLAAMTVTSFRPGRQLLSTRQWSVLHKIGIYFLWGTVWSTYWYELYYYTDIQLIDYVLYWAGIVAWGFRVWAWTSERLKLVPA
ncbi:MAG: hypothetical protein ACE5KS_08885 [Woeseiaceae bacterium]